MVDVPVKQIGSETWLLLGDVVGKSTIIRAVSIKVESNRVSDPGTQHKYDQARAEGSIKCKIREWDITRILGHG
jgi:hypothetical protein